VITSTVVKNAVDSYATSVALDTIDGNGVGFPLSVFSWHHPSEGASIAKAFGVGQWPTRRFVRTMPITIEGAILSRTTTEYWTQRKTLMNYCLPAPNNVEFTPIKIELVLDGDPNTYFAFCAYESSEGILDVDTTHSPTVSHFQLNYICYEGYWTGPTGLVRL
jgi:hypothetical protein